MTAWRRPDAFPNSHRLYLGQSGLAAAPSTEGSAGARRLHLGNRHSVGAAIDVPLQGPPARRRRSSTCWVYAEGLGGPFPGVTPILSDPHHFLTKLIEAAQRADPDPGVVKVRF